jgi:hypothetical protein
MNLTTNSIQGPAIFDSWSEYQLKLLFNFWNIQNEWQFALSCIVIICGCMGLFGLILLRQYLKHNITIHCNMNLVVERPEDTAQLVYKKKVKQSTGLWCIKLCYFIASLLFYCLLLFLALITTTMNPWLFISLVFGYSLGEILILDQSIQLKLEDRYI